MPGTNRTSQPRDTAPGYDCIRVVVQRPGPSAAGDIAALAGVQSVEVARHVGLEVTLLVRVRPADAVATQEAVARYAGAAGLILTSSTLEHGSLEGGPVPPSAA